MTTLVKSYPDFFDLVHDVSLMPDMTASILEHITAERGHVVLFNEVVDLFFCYFHA